jgi:hypothetical protein
VRFIPPSRSIRRNAQRSLLRPPRLQLSEWIETPCGCREIKPNEEKRAVLNGVEAELRRIIGKPPVKAVDPKLRLAA